MAAAARFLKMSKSLILRPVFAVVGGAGCPTPVGVACAALAPVLPILDEDEVPFCFIMSDALDCNVFRPPVFLLFASAPLDGAW